MSSMVDDGRDPTAYGDRGILLLCSTSRSSMSAVSRVSHPCGESVFRSESIRNTYKAAEMVLVYMLEGGGQRDQFRLGFHPPIVGSALDVCPWVCNPIVQHICDGKKRTCGLRRLQSARHPSCDYPIVPLPFPRTSQLYSSPQATALLPVPPHQVLIVPKVHRSNGPKIRPCFRALLDGVSG